MKIFNIQPKVTPAAQQTDASKSADVKTKNCLWGGLCGYLGAGVVSATFRNDIQNYLTDGRNNLAESLSRDDVLFLNKSADYFVEKKGLAKKGITVLNATAENIDEVKQELQNKYKQYASKKFKNGINPEKLKKQMKKWSQEVDRNSNTVYDKRIKTLIVNGKNPGLGIFNNVSQLAQSKYGAMGVLSKLSNVRFLTIPIILTAVCSRNKIAPDGQELSKKDKFTNFVRQNAGKLSMLTFVPAILYSGASSARALAAANKLLTKNLIKEVAFHEGAGFAAMLLSVGVTGMAAACGVDIKNWMQKRQDKKAIAQAQQPQAQPPQTQQSV